MNGSESLLSPFSNAYVSTPRAYLVDAASGLGRLFGGHAFLLIEGIIEKQYILERIEIFAAKSHGDDDNSNSCSGLHGLVTAIKFRSFSANLRETTDLSGAKALDPIPKDPEEKKKFDENLIKLTGSSNNYEMYEINNDNFTRLRRLIRIRQISFSELYARAMLTVQDNERLRNLFTNNINEKQRELINKAIKKDPRFRTMTPDCAFLTHTENTIKKLTFTDESKVGDNITLDQINTQHEHAVNYLELMCCKEFREAIVNDPEDGSTSKTRGIFTYLLFMLAETKDPETQQNLLPEEFLRFSLAGPNNNFSGSASAGDRVNCLAWAKSILQDVGLNVVETNKPKMLGTSCLIL